jgi:hypothetical protein
MRVAHYLTPLKTDRVPATHIAFDCETRLTTKYGKKAHRWDCGCATVIRRDFQGQWSQLITYPVGTPAELWAFIADCQKGQSKIVVWAHNLPFDLRISEALRYLPQFGYSLEAIVLERTAAWASFESELGKLLICDLYSWLPVSLDQLASDMGKPRPRFDYMNADRLELLKRCRDDTVLTGEIVQIILEWLDIQKAGPLRPTGGGQSHAMWRRHTLPEKTVLVHEDQHALERERRAMWAGRAEVWKHSTIEGPIYEHDLNLAYCRIAATCNVPVRLLHRKGKTPLEALDGEETGQAYLADVTVEVNKPLVPTGDDGHVLWPVGRFETTLWDPEISLLKDKGANVTVNRVWVYRTAPVLAPMAQWLINCLTDDEVYVPAPMRRLLKHWARTLVGRCALRYRQWEYYGTVPVMGLSLSKAIEEGEPGEKERLHVGTEILELAAMAEADTSVPQITGWVMSEARVRLWTLMEAAGPRNLLYVDTDGLLVNAAGHHALAPYENWYGFRSLRHKATWAKAEITGPRNLILEGERRIAGIPRRAVRIGDVEYDGEVWAGIKSSLSGRQLDSVAVMQRQFKVEALDHRRQHLPDGETQPYEVNETDVD